ncbi:MAG: Zn-ribbon domain-containing OB-fold protein [Deltaproteobacteria bacterium]|nr:Zn-ribbon domain-containing OB-fold protein [Deltaproteobacteria bacterium]
MAKKDIDGRFHKFGTVSFTSTTKVNDFIDKLEQGKVSATRCKDCGMVFFPPRADCYKCLSSNMEWLDVTGTGKLLTYSTLQYAPVGFEGDLPYTIALLDYGDYKVFGRISGDLSPEEIEVGMEMKTVVNEMQNGQFNYVFQKA